jgi:hypothetical protein
MQTQVPNYFAVAFAQALLLTYPTRTTPTLFRLYLRNQVVAVVFDQRDSFQPETLTSYQ